MGCVRDGGAARHRPASAAEPGTRCPSAPPRPGQRGHDAILRGPCTSCRPGVAGRPVPGHVQLCAVGSVPWAPCHGLHAVGSAPWAPSWSPLPHPGHRSGVPPQPRCQDRHPVPPLLRAGACATRAGRWVGAPSPRANRDEPRVITGVSVFSPPSPQAPRELCFPASPACHCSPLSPGTGPGAATGKPSCVDGGATPARAGGHRGCWGCGPQPRASSGAARSPPQQPRGRRRSAETRWGWGPGAILWVGDVGPGDAPRQPPDHRQRVPAEGNDGDVGPERCRRVGAGTWG